jgi:hypothetical protein
VRPGDTESQDLLAIVARAEARETGTMVATADTATQSPQARAGTGAATTFRDGDRRPR